MIIYGSRAKHLATQQSPEACNSCGTQNSVQLHVFQKYAHVFWIPFFPIGKTAASECQHCKQVLKSGEFTPTTKITYDNVKRESKTPVWMFSGLALLVAFIIFSSYQGNQRDKRKAALVLAPVAGDIFQIKTEDNQYTLYKVADVQGDTVFVRFNQYETNKASGLYELKSKGDSAFSQLAVSILKSELKKMLEKGEITDIERE